MRVWRETTDFWQVFWAMVQKELTILTRYPVGFVASFGQIFLIVAVFVLAGLTFSSGGAEGAFGGGSGVVIYGFVLYMFMTDTLWTVGYNVRREQVQGTLEQLYLSPASKFASLVARVAHLLIWTGLLSVAGALLMAAMLGSLPFENPGFGLYLLVMSLLGTFGMGFAFAALTLTIREAAQNAVNFLQFGLLILCANFFPFAALPPAMLAVSRVIPLAYAVDAFRSTMMGYPPGYPELAPIQTETIIVTLFGILTPLLGYGLYRRAEKQARRYGTLSKY
jgi:ABC-2 type transport system permease protein